MPSNLRPLAFKFFIVLFCFSIFSIYAVVFSGSGKWAAQYLLPLIAVKLQSLNAQVKKSYIKERIQYLFKLLKHKILDYKLYERMAFLQMAATFYAWLY